MSASVSLPVSVPMPRGLYAITPVMPDTDALCARVRAACEGGAVLVQYRAKNISPDDALKQASRLQELCAALGVPLIINDNAALALTVGAAGVHLGQEDGTLKMARTKLGMDALIGVSCYDDFSLAQEAVHSGASYVAFGAMYPSITKPHARSADMSLITRAKRELHLPVAAIGGITVENAPPLIAAGADLVAVISDLFEAPDIARRANQYAALFASIVAPPISGVHHES